jgi:RNA polymerase sigma-70 factor (ECF subfamily)
VSARCNDFARLERRTLVRLGKRPVSAEIERVYATRYASFCRLASTVTGNVEAAHDAVQEGFARALARRDEFRGDGSLEGWLWRIVLRVALDGRKHGRLRPLVLYEDSESMAAQWVPVLPHPELDPELADALRALPERQRLVVFLRYFADLSHAEIAAITGMRSGTVSATLAHAKTALARRLDGRLLPGEREAAS